MSNEFLSHLLSSHLLKKKVQNKEKYLADLHDAISRCFSGRVGVEISNNFLFEAEHMIANSIKLYEEGYFDAAFYSLRATLELLMLLVYFVEHQREDLEALIRKWNRLDYMDTYSRMEKYLDKNSELFSNIKTNMREYFESIKNLNNSLNKKVHKQSFKNLYTNRSHPFVGKKIDLDKELHFFENSVKKMIGAVIVFRLFIDPMPVLLMDKEMFLRTKDTMSGPLADEFVEDYIGNKHIELYKRCDLYQSHYEELIKEEKLYESVAYLIKYNIIDLSKKEELEEQFNQLSDQCKLAYLISSTSDKIYAIDMYNGFYKFMTSNIPDQKQPYYKNMKHREYYDLKKDIINESFEDIYISIFPANQSNIFIEQSDKLGPQEIEVIRDYVKKYKHLI